MLVSVAELPERLFQILRSAAFLNMKGQANEVPLFIQTYDPKDEDHVRSMLEGLVARLKMDGLVVNRADFFELVLADLKAKRILSDLLQNEASFTKEEVLETLRNCSDPRTLLVPRLGELMKDRSQLTLLTGSGRLFPFLRTHTILESLQPAMLHHPIVIFFPGQYEQDPAGGSHLKLFGSIPSPVINNPYYRASNLDNYRI